VKLLLVLALSLAGCAVPDFRLHAPNLPLALLNQTMRAADNFADRGHWRPVSRPLLDIGPISVSTSLRVRVNWDRLLAGDWLLRHEDKQSERRSPREPGDFGLRFHPSSHGAYFELTFFF